MATKVLWRSWLPPVVGRRQAAFAFAPSRSFAQVVNSIDKNTGRPTRRREDPLKFPSVGYETIPDDEIADEEQFPETNLTEYYPAKIGEILQDRYQIIAKVGCGGLSTVWLGRDLIKNKYVTIKICIHSLVRNRELEFYRHYKKWSPISYRNDVVARGLIRKLYSSFSVHGPHGKHTVMILQPAQMCWLVLGNRYDEKRDHIDEKHIKHTISALLFTVFYLHYRVRCVHTDIHRSNLLVESDNDEPFRMIEKTALETPQPRKLVGNHTLYRPLVCQRQPGRTLVAGFGHAHVGLGPHTKEDIMPIQLRAPEVVLKQPWTWPVDVWSIGLLAWELMQNTILFPSCGKQQDLCERVSDSEYDAVHLAQMVAALGPPPAYLLDQNPERASEFWRREEVGSDDGGDSKWTWASKKAQIPVERTLEAMQTKLKEPDLFLQFIRRALTWDPDERPTALQLSDDPWLVNPDYLALDDEDDADRFDKVVDEEIYADDEEEEEYN